MRALRKLMLVMPLLAAVSLLGGHALAMDMVVGETLVYLDAARENIRTKETTAGNLVIDAMREFTGADVGITNGGGIREFIEPGPITLEELLTLLPFENTVVTIELTGAEIIAALEHGVSMWPELWGGFPHVSGLAYVFDGTQPPGSRIVEVRYQGEPIDPNAKFVVATNGFLTAGGDGYEMLNKPVLQEFGSMQEVLIQYLMENSPVAPKVEGRIVQIGEVK